MRVNLINYAMPGANRSVGAMSRPVAFGNTPLQRLESIGFINPANGNCRVRLDDEKERLGINILLGEGVDIERNTNEYSIHSNRDVFCLPQELLDASKTRFAELDLSHDGRCAEWDYWTTRTEEGTKLLVNILCACREATAGLVAKGKEILAKSM